MYRIALASLILILALGLAGCGGGGTSVTPGGGGGASAGLMAVQGKINPPAVVTTPTVNAYGMSGTITRATINHTQPTADESEIVFSYYGPGGHTIAAINADGTGMRTVISGLPNVANQLRVTPDCTYVYYLRSSNLQRVPLAGGPETTLIAGVQSFALTPSGAKVFFRKTANAELWLANANGTSPTLIVDTVGDPASVIACPTETVGWVKKASLFQITVALAPGGPINGGGTGNLNPNRWQAYDPVSNTSLLEVDQSGSFRHWGFYFNGTNIGGFGDHGFGPSGISEGALEPGGKRLAIVRYNGSDYELDLADLSGLIQSNLFQWSYINSCIYSPYRQSRPIVGPGTAWPTGVGALMFTQVGQGVRGAAIADGTSNTLLVSETNGGSGNVVYNVTNDGVLTKLYTAYGHCHTWTPIVNGNTGLKGALISFDYNTGRVGSIVTYTKKPTLQKAPGGYRLVGGEVVDVFDAKGTRRPASGPIQL